MAGFICPVCNGALVRCGKVYVCPDGHSYDIAHSGYVNLLMSNASSKKRHGDDKVMVDARKRFLEKGYYDILRNKIDEICVKYSPENVDILDAGCGEGYYTVSVYNALKSAGKNPDMSAFDISKNALMALTHRERAINTAVGSIFSIPMADSSCDIVQNIFAPCDMAEFLRVLKPGAVLIKVIPLEKHLMGLKKAVYDHPYENAAANIGADGFDIAEKNIIRDYITLSSQKDIQDLFMMTPYYYKTGKADQEKLLSYESLDTEIEFGIIVYRK